MEDIVQPQRKRIPSHFSLWIMKWLRSSVEISMKVRGESKPKKSVQNFTHGSKVSDWQKIVGAKFCCHSVVAKWKKLKNKKLKQQISRLTHLDVHHMEKNCVSAHIWNSETAVVQEFFYQEVLHDLQTLLSCSSRTRCGLIWVIDLFAGLSLVVAFIPDWRLYCSLFLLVLYSFLCH